MGGGGTVLEHRFGAVVLTHLLAGSPMPGLGDHITVDWVRFQTRGLGPVDDILVAGTAPNGAPRRLAIGVRRNPQLTAGDPKSVALVASYLTMVAQRWPHLASGRVRLALAVVPSCRPALELKALADIAGDDPTDFRRRMQTVGRPNHGLRQRLNLFDDLVRAACATIDPAGVAAAELSWRLLSKLSLIEIRLEGADTSDRTAAVERLQRTVAPGASLTRADQLFSRLGELVDGYVPAGDRVTEARLRADLYGQPFFTAPNDAASAAPAAPARRRRAGTTYPREALEVWPPRATASAEARQPLVCEGTVVVRDRYSLLALDAGSGEALWQHNTAFRGAPALGDSSVYLPGRSHEVVTRDLRSGRTRRPELAIRMRDGQAVFDNGTLYAPSPDGVLQALDASSRTVVWTAAVEGSAFPPLIRDTTAYAVAGGPGGHQVHALDALSGVPQWHCMLTASQILFRSIGGQALHLVHETGTDTVLTALGTADGARLWEHPLTAGPAAAPVEAEGVVVLADRSGQAWALDASDGAVLWRHSLGQRISTAPVPWQGRFFIASWKPNRIVCLHARTGETQWKATAQGAFAAQPFVSGGTVYAADRAGTLTGWDAETGRRVFRTDGLLWNPDLQGEPAVHDGVLYATTGRGTLRALRLSG